MVFTIWKSTVASERLKDTMDQLFWNLMQPGGILIESCFELQFNQNVSVCKLGCLPDSTSQRLGLNNWTTSDDWISASAGSCWRKRFALLKRNALWKHGKDFCERILILTIVSASSENVILNRFRFFRSKRNRSRKFWLQSLMLIKCSDDLHDDIW